jgi:ATP-dependent protease ClpP protease subunit
VLERDRFFTPEEARDYGLVDRVMESRNGYSPSSS